MPKEKMRSHHLPVVFVKILLRHLLPSAHFDKTSLIFAQNTCRSRRTLPSNATTMTITGTTLEGKETTREEGVDDVPVTTNQEAINEDPIGHGKSLPTGARLIIIKRAGCLTWMVCAVVCVVTLGMGTPLGLWAFVCPCDETRAYEVNGEVYDENGQPLGPISKFRTA